MPKETAQEYEAKEEHYHRSDQSHPYEGRLVAKQQVDYRQSAQAQDAKKAKERKRED